MSCPSLLLESGFSRDDAFESSEIDFVSCPSLSLESGFPRDDGFKSSGLDFVSCPSLSLESGFPRDDGFKSSGLDFVSCPSLSLESGFPRDDGFGSSGLDFVSCPSLSLVFRFPSDDDFERSLIESDVSLVLVSDPSSLSSTSLELPFPLGNGFRSAFNFSTLELDWPPSSPWSLESCLSGIFPEVLGELVRSSTLRFSVGFSELSADGAVIGSNLLPVLVFLGRLPLSKSLAVTDEEPVGKKMLF